MTLYPDGYGTRSRSQSPATLPVKAALFTQKLHR